MIVPNDKNIEKYDKTETHRMHNGYCVKSGPNGDRLFDKNGQFIQYSSSEI